MIRLLAAYPWSGLFQGLLDGIGWILAKIYDAIPNYGVAIIILTILIRVVLLPLGIKQIKSMQAMQAIQPKVKELQKKYKGNKQKQQEETMKLYREAGVNPLGGCLPLLLQFPILISMYAVIRAPIVVPVPPSGDLGPAYAIQNNHLPTDSALFHNVVSHEGTGFLAMNLQCSAAQAGTTVALNDKEGDPIVPGRPLEVDGAVVPGVTSKASLDCGANPVAKLPYFVILALMIGSTFYQQRQMTRASPAGAQSQQQQMIMKVMPVMFGVLGYTFPAGLVVYWTTSNALQIGQQYALLRAGHIGPDALERRKQEMENKPAKRGGMFSGMMARAEEERKRREPPAKPRPAKGGSPSRNPRPGTSKKGGAGGGGAPKGGAPKGGAPKGGAPKGGAPKGGAPKGGAPKGGTPKGGGPPRRDPGTSGRPPGPTPEPPETQPGGDDGSGS
jgi:YidC/Oxa1 family membrane protein insertase